LPGFFGKIPARGDFVSRRLDPSFRSGIDDWLQRCTDVSRRQLGTAWLESYLNTPVWRFVLGPGLLCDSASAGVMIPSVDRVGRYFPLILAVQLPGCRSPATLLHAARDWFDAAEAVILTVLDDEFDFETFDTAVLHLGLPPYSRSDADRGAGALRLGLDANGDMTGAYGQILDQVLVGSKVGFSLWWTLGSDKVRASVLLGSGMPGPTSFAAFLDGKWSEWGWKRPAEGETTLQDMPLLMLKPVVVMPSAARTHPGTRRKRNEDAFLLRPEVALWAVADGVGGHDAAQAASREVVEHLEKMLPPLSFGSAVEELRELLGEANASLRARAAVIADSSIVASTVVVLMVYGGHFCLLWSGDSPAYRWRNGEIQRLTKDHVTKLGGQVTHAVGAEAELFIDVVKDRVEPGDRFLLCSDGVVKVLDDLALQELLTEADPGRLVDAIMDDCLVAGAKDNITAVVVMTPPA
jgi:type VI secretion system protein ImpM